MENKNVLYGVIGLLVGIVLVCCLFACHRPCHKGGEQGMMHRMPNGQMMNNVGMDMDDMMGGMMSDLEGKTGDDFDKAFLHEMIMHHQGAVVMAEAVIKTSKRPELIKLANEIITAQTKEIEMMQSWQKAWFK